MAVWCHVYMPDCELSSYAGDVYAHNILVGESAKPTLLDYGELPPHLLPVILPCHPCISDQKLIFLGPAFCDALPCRLQLSEISSPRNIPKLYMVRFSSEEGLQGQYVCAQAPRSSMSRGRSRTRRRRRALLGCF